MTSLLLAGALGVALAGPADRLYGLADAPAGKSATAAALQAAKVGAKVPRKLHRKVLPRTAAWTTLGRLSVLDAEVVSSARTALLADANHPEVRARAAWALGELSRGRAWDEVRPIAGVLQEAMVDDIDALTAHMVVEAFGKAWVPHEHSFDDNLKATKAMNTLAANQIEQMPSVYYVVLNRVMSFEVAVQLLKDEVAEARQRRDEQQLAEAYNAVLTTVRWVAGRQDQLTSGYASDREKIEAAFSGLLGALDLRDRRVTLMLVWSFGNISKEPVFADLVGPRMSRVVAETDPMVRILTAWSLYRLRISLPARETLRDAVLAEESDARVLEMLARMRTDDAELDAIQKLYAVEPSP